MSNVVNLNKYRKKKARIEKEKRAETNRRLHGRTKAERARDALQKKRLSAQVDGAQLERSGTSAEDTPARATLFHITSRGAWEEAQLRGLYEAPSLRSEGFIHLSAEHQWVSTAHRFFQRQAGLVLLGIDANRLEGAVTYEAADGDEFPHLYGPLNTGAVVYVRDLSIDDDGKLHLGPEMDP